MLRLLLAVLLLVVPSQALADIKIQSNGLKITGDIKKADAEFVESHLGDLIKKHQIVFLDSGGGDIAAVMAIGRIIRKFEWSTSVGDLGQFG